MVKKVISISSLAFALIIFLCGLDFVNLQNNYNSLNNISTEVAYHISKSSRADKEFISSLENHYQVKIAIQNDSMPLYGDECDFIVSTYYYPFSISFDAMEVKVRRLTILGYYG